MTVSQRFIHSNDIHDQSSLPSELGGPGAPTVSPVPTGLVFTAGPKLIQQPTYSSKSVISPNILARLLSSRVFVSQRFFHSDYIHDQSLLSCQLRLGAAVPARLIFIAGPKLIHQPTCSTLLDSGLYAKNRYSTIRYTKQLYAPCAFCQSCEANDCTGPLGITSADGSRFRRGMTFFPPRPESDTFVIHRNCIIWIREHHKFDPGHILMDILRVRGNPFFG